MDVRGLTTKFLKAARRTPRFADWAYSTALLLLQTAILLPVGLRSGFLRVEPLHSPLPRVLILAGTTFVFPALAEECLFRVLLLPGPRADAKTWWRQASLSLTVFVLCHPARAPFDSSARRAVFTDPVFLLMAAVLGLTCTLAYRRTGSLWPPVLIHWLTVLGWLLLFGGYAKLAMP